MSFSFRKKSTLEDQHGTKHHCFADSFQNKQLCDSNEIQSLSDKLELASN
jgi:hypothetical protein